MYFEDKFLWEKCQFEDLTKEDFEYGVENYWKGFPDWFSLNLLMRGKQRVINFINCKNMFNTYPLDHAVICGNLEFVKWIFYNTTEGYSTDAMDYAIGYRYLDIFEWLYKNTTKGCNCAIDIASIHDDFELVKLLYDHQITKFTDTAITFSISNNNLDILKILHKIDCNAISKCLHDWNNLGCFNHPSIIMMKWLYKNRALVYVDIKRLIEIVSKDIEIAQYLRHKLDKLKRRNII
jgi:hypothetical protein